MEQKINNPAGEEMPSLIKKRGPKVSTYGLERKVNKKGENKEKKGGMGAKNKIDKEVKRVVEDLVSRVEEKD